MAVTHAERMKAVERREFFRDINVRYPDKPPTRFLRLDMKTVNPSRNGRASGQASHLRALIRRGIL